MKKILQIIIGFLLFCVLLRACGAIHNAFHEHDWQDATCTAPRTCSICNKTDGEALGHDWQDSTCISPETCSRCGATRGDKSDHKWEPATCNAPQTCSVCGKTNGDSLGHIWEPATFEKPSTCSRCGEESGNVLPSYAYSRGQYVAWNQTPTPEQFIGMTGYVAVCYHNYMYPSSVDYYKNDWFNTPWHANIYAKDKQFWNVVGTVEHKTAVKVLGQELSQGGHGTHSYDGYLLVERISDGEQFYIYVSDFVVNPYWENSDILSVLEWGPVLAVYHQVSDYYPTNSSDSRADVEDGEIVLVRGRTSGGKGFGDPETNPVDALAASGRCYFNPDDLTIIY